MKVISADEMRTLWSDVTMPAEPTEAQGARPAPLHRSRPDGVAAQVNELFRIEWDRVWPAVLIAVGGLIVLLVMRRDDD